MTSCTRTTILLSHVWGGALLGEVPLCPPHNVTEKWSAEPARQPYNVKIVWNKSQFCADSPGQTPVHTRARRGRVSLFPLGCNCICSPYT